MFISDRQQKVKLSNRPTKGKLQMHAVFVRRKVAKTLVFTATVLLICIKNAKSFTTTTTTTTTSVLFSRVPSSETTLLFLTSYSKLTKRRLFRSCPSERSVRPAPSSGHGTGVSLRMTPGVTSSSSGAARPAMLDMKTSIGAFGGWYNTMDPVARPSVYNEE